MIKKEEIKDMLKLLNKYDKILKDLLIELSKYDDNYKDLIIELYDKQ